MPNHLASESSPYLQQHADNPVEWYPWGPAASERARAEDRPILLSVGYSSCHWCHVMERESFEDESVAALMNESFVNVKVDREERPDVDQVYMQAVQAMTGHGGWPLTVFLTPEGEPYYGGTYFPPRPRQGMPSFRQVLEAAARAYAERPQDVRRGAAQLLSALRTTLRGVERDGSPETPSDALLEHGSRFLSRQYDANNGGFGQAPKFPQPVTLELLLRDHVRTGQRSSLHMALHTLRRMASGGIFDHLGGGFHRYSVDARWLVPHFEKMLYDNALLARVYVDAYKLTGDETERDVAERTLDYLLRDMRGPSGGFFTALDADSEGEEGRFYVWAADEVRAVLGPEDSEAFARCYDVTTGGNFEGRNVLWLPRRMDEVAADLGIERQAFGAMMARCREALREVRDNREAPFRDEKVLTGWNAMTVRTFAEAGAAFGRADYVVAAEGAADFLLDALRPKGQLLHVFKDGTAKVPGFLEDHAALGNALLSLHAATLETRWLREARWCVDATLSAFWDESDGLFHDAPKDGEALFMRARDPMDNATPSGNSLAAELLVRAGHIFGDTRYEEVAVRAMSAEAAAMRRFPSAFGRLFCVADRWLAPPVEVVLVGERSSPDTRALLDTVSPLFHRNITIVGRDPEEDEYDVPLFEGRGQVNGKATAYVCEGYACQAPVTEPSELGRAFAKLMPDPSAP